MLGLGSQTGYSPPVKAPTRSLCTNSTNLPLGKTLLRYPACDSQFYILFFDRSLPVIVSHSAVIQRARSRMKDFPGPVIIAVIAAFMLDSILVVSYRRHIILRPCPWNHFDFCLTSRPPHAERIELHISLASRARCPSVMVLVAKTV